MIFQREINLCRDFEYYENKTNDKFHFSANASTGE